MWRRRIERALLIALGVQVIVGAALLGGVHPAVQLWLSASALALLFVVVLLRHVKRGTFGFGAPFWILIALAGVCGLQVLGLTVALHQWLQPRGAALAAYSTEGLGPLWHRCLSLDPPGTAMEVCKMLGLAALTGSAALLARDRSRALLVLWSIAIGGLVLAVVAALQLAIGAGTIYGFYRPEVSAHIVSPFVNANHAGAFYAAIGFLQLGLGLGVTEPRRRLLMVGLAALPFGLVVASASRGAIVATVVGGVALFFVLRRLGKLTRRQLGYGLAITVILGTVALPASGTVRREFGAKTTVETVSEEAKVKVWGNALTMARDFPVTGVGRGAFRAVFPSYHRVSPGLKVTYSHAESWVVQLLVELGPALFSVLLLLVGWAVWRYFRAEGLQEVPVIALLPVGVLLLQNLVDFNLEFPGTAFLFVVLIGVVAGLARGRTQRVESRLRRRLHLASSLSFVVVSGLILLGLGRSGVRFDLREEGKRIQAEINRAERPKRALAMAREAIRRHPADYYLHHLAGVAALQVVGELPLRHFNRALYLNPRSGATQRQVGRALWQLGFRQQALTHYAQAIRLGILVRGNVAGELYRLLGQLWLDGDLGAARLLASNCLGGLPDVGGLPAVSCWTALVLERDQRSQSFELLARREPVAAATLARRFERDGRAALARNAYQRILAHDPKNTDLLAAIATLAAKDADLVLALHWAEALLAAEPKAAAYDRLGGLWLKADRRVEAEKVADRGLARYSRSPGLVALKAELMLLRGARAGARALIREATVGRSLTMREELRLLRLRVKLEQGEGNRLRLERIRSRIRQIQRLLKAGARGSTIQR